MTTQTTPPYLHCLNCDVLESEHHLNEYACEEFDSGCGCSTRVYNHPRPGVCEGGPVAGWVTGDWTLLIAETERKYPVAAFGPYWNGLATPLVTRAVAEQIVEDQQLLIDHYDSPDMARLSWDGDSIRVHYPDPRIDDFTVEPAPFYDLGLGWAWVQV